MNSNQIDSIELLAISKKGTLMQQAMLIEAMAIKDKAFSFKGHCFIEDLQIFCSMLCRSAFAFTFVEARALSVMAKRTEIFHD